MTDIITLTSKDRTNIERHFGKEFYGSLNFKLNKCIQKWQLTAMTLIHSYSVNLVFRCTSELYGETILKMSKSVEELKNEYRTLNAFGSHRFCEVYDADFDIGALIEECLIPGNTLREIESIEKRVSVFYSVYNSLHVLPNDVAAYKTYQQWVFRITDYMSTRTDFKELYEFMDEAKRVYIDLNVRYNLQLLLHGDFHHDNILLTESGGYKVIDPKGVVGDPLFDIPRFILNELWIEKNSDMSYTRVNDVVEQISDFSGIPSEDIRSAFYVEGMMAICWCVEDGAREEDCVELMAQASFAKAVWRAEQK